MYAKEINKKIKTYNVLPSTYSGKKYYLAGFEKQKVFLKLKHQTMTVEYRNLKS
jgi:hypothetical protein